MAEIIDREFGWDDIIENDSAEFVLLPEGEYDFRVTGFERGRHPGSDKIPPCHKAILSITIEAPEGTATIQENLFLHSKSEWKLCEFFTAIGQRKRGEKLQMNWSRVIGATGRCKIYVDTWTGRDGDERKSNKIKRFCEPVEPQDKAPATPSYIPGSF